MGSLVNRLEEVQALPRAPGTDTGTLALIEAADRREGHRQEAGIMRHEQQRRIDLANAVTPMCMKALGALIATLAASRYGELGKETVTVLVMVAVLIPLMGSAYCIVVLAVSRGLWRSELRAAFGPLCYEATFAGGIGHAHARYRQVMGASSWLPATADIAGVAWFFVWALIEIGVRYYLG